MVKPNNTYTKKKQQVDDIPERSRTTELRTSRLDSQGAIKSAAQLQ